MDSTLKGDSETLYIPLWGKADMSRQGLILSDPKAEEIVARCGYSFSKNTQNRFISIYMAVRAAILDDFANDFIARHPEGIVLHLGCGLDSRVCRIKKRPALWVDVDLPDVIAVRQKYYEEDQSYRMLAASAAQPEWLAQFAQPDRPALVIAEGLTMYLTAEENQRLILALRDSFASVEYGFDAYSLSAVKWSKWKNPVNQMGAVIRWGLDDPALLEGSAPGITHTATRYFTDDPRLSQLTGMTKALWRVLYGNPWADSLYRIYFYHLERPQS